MKKTILMVILAAIMLVSLVGCGGQAEESTAPSKTEEPVNEAATEPSEPSEQAETVIKAAGSTSVGPVIEALAELYTEAYPNVSIDVEQTGSGAGVTSCGDGTADLGMASRNLKDEEKKNYPDMQAHVLCLDGVSVVVNADNPVKELSAEQVKGIFLGEITNWSEVGGADLPITLYSRDSSSGTREAFQTLFLGKDDQGEEIVIDDTLCIIQDSNGAIGTAVEGDASAIGYMSLGIAPNYKVASLTIDGVEATIENLVTGDYKYFRNFNLLTMGNPQDTLAEFITFCTTDEDAISYMKDKGYVMP